MATKKCSTCNVEKDTSEFNKQTRSKSGFKSECRECQHLNYLANRDAIIAAAKKYDSEHKEQRKENVRRYGELHREERILYHRGYRIKNYTERIQKDREYYAAHREHALETVKKYNKTPKGKLIVAKSRHNRQKHHKINDCSLTLEQWNKIVLLQRNTCAMCGIEFTDECKPTKDHIVPLSKGGGLTFENTQALCRSCNCKKNDKLDYGKLVTWFHVETITPSIVNRRREAQNRYWAKPGSRERHSEIQKKRYERPEEHLKSSEARRKVMESPTARKKLSDAKKKSYIDRQWYGSVSKGAIVS
jgi:hypothetical protein